MHYIKAKLAALFASTGAPIDLEIWLTSVEPNWQTREVSGLPVQIAWQAAEYCGRWCVPSLLPVGEAAELASSAPVTKASFRKVLCTALLNARLASKLAQKKYVQGKAKISVYRLEVIESGVGAGPLIWELDALSGLYKCQLDLQFLAPPAVISKRVQDEKPLFDQLISVTTLAKLTGINYQLIKYAEAKIPGEYIETKRFFYKGVALAWLAANPLGNCKRGPKAKKIGGENT